MDVSALLSNLDRSSRAAQSSPVAKLAVLTDLEAILCATNPRQSLTALFDGPLGARLLPEVAALDMEQPEGGRHKDNLVHSILVAARTPRNRLVRWAGLLHDVGKPATRRVVDGKVSFHNHEQVGASLIRFRLGELGYTSQFADQVVTVVIAAGRISSFEDTWTDSAVRRVATQAADLLSPACMLARADCTSRHEHRRRAAAQRVSNFEKRWAQISAADAAAAVRPVLDGAQIMEVTGLEPGPRVGQLRKELMRLAESDPTFDEAAARRWLAEQVT